MTIEDMYFPKSRTDIHFDYLVREIANLITHFTVESVIPTDSINRSLAKGDGLKDGRIHSKGSEFIFQEFIQGSEFVFEIKFEGEGKRFRITYEVNGSSPNGILTYMVEPDGGHALFSKIKGFLKSVSGGNKDYVAVSVPGKAEEPEVAANKPDNIEDNVEEKVAEEKIKDVKESENKNESLIVIPEGRNCACPQDSFYSSTESFEIFSFSSRLRKLYFKEWMGVVGIYKCEHCGRHLLFERIEIERGPDNFTLVVISEETSAYLLSMKSQLDVVIEDKGVNIVRQMLASDEKN